MTEQLWNKHAIAAELGISAGSVNRWISRHDLTPASTEIERGRVVNYYRPADIRAARASDPGRGAPGKRRSTSPNDAKGRTTQ